jgi:hypothetical protein
MATTGIIVANARRASADAPPIAVAPRSPNGARGHLDAGMAAARVGDFSLARANWEEFVRLSPHDPSVPRVQAALDAATRLQQFLDGTSNGA